MKIIKDSQGWRIEPSTDQEEKALTYLLEALQQTYGKPVESGETGHRIVGE